MTESPIAHPATATKTVLFEGKPYLSTVVLKYGKDKVFIGEFIRITHGLSTLYLTREEYEGSKYQLFEHRLLSRPLAWG